MNNKEILKYLINKSYQQKVDYIQIKNDSVQFLNDLSDDCYINFIIPVRGRLNFTELLFKSFEDARNNFDKKIIFTIVEHSEVPEHSKFYRKQKANYIFINSKQGELFNKCLSYNIGILSTSPARYYLFHDLDILVQKDFFNKVAENIDNSGVSALQCYTKRRVLNCDVNITNQLLRKEIDVNNLSDKIDGVNLPMYNGQPSLGSKGGSILVKKDIVDNVGGFDPEIFKAYSAEDNFFWEKVSTVTEIGYADNPEIEVFHMYHEPQFNKNPFLHEMERDYMMFKGLPQEDKLMFLDFKRKLFNESR